MKRLILLAMSFWMYGFGAYAQNAVRGTVTSSQGEPVAGATVGIKNTQKGTTTDASGRYVIQVEAGQDSLIFSSVGYEEQAVAINGRTTLDVVLQEKVVSLNNLVVIGYGMQKKSDLSSAISSVDVDALQRNAVLPNAGAALEGTTPGLSVTPSSGAPGADLNIRVRGSNTFGNNNPLVIIDGAPGDLNNINPSDIASMQVLKDAAAAAIYGSRAANGVLIVTTKNGQAGPI